MSTTATMMAMARHRQRDVRWSVARPMPTVTTSRLPRCHRDNDGSGGDSDGDGILTAMNAGWIPCPDSDGDGIPTTWTPTTKRWHPTARRATADADSDGMPDYRANNVDTDGDGVMDVNDSDDDVTARQPPEIGAGGPWPSRCRR
ncbi:MAG: hypothetical protein R2867_43780 [Caldilineaceae bacterium]